MRTGKSRFAFSGRELSLKIDRIATGSQKPVSWEASQEGQYKLVFSLDPGPSDIVSKHCDHAAP